MFFQGEYDIKDINITDTPTTDNQNEDLNNNINISTNKTLESLTTYKDLDEAQLKTVVEFLIDLENKLHLYDLEFNKLENEYLNDVLSKKNDAHKKHLKQISSIVTHVDKLVTDDDKSTCLVELGAGRGKLSYWFEQSRINKDSSEEKTKNFKFNILLIERGSQRFKFDGMLKKDMEETNAEFERIRIDLKDLFINKVPLIQRSSDFIMYGKHLCGCATDFSLRCLKHALEDPTEAEIKFKGLVLAVCCHHKCEWDSFCGKDFLKKYNIDSKLFYIIRSISSWSTSGERNSTPPPGYFFLAYI